MAEVLTILFGAAGLWLCIAGFFAVCGAWLPPAYGPPSE